MLNAIALGAFLVLTGANGNHIWVKEDQIVAVFDCARCGGTAPTAIATTDGKTIWVTESPDKVMQELQGQ